MKNKIKLIVLSLILSIMAISVSFACEFHTEAYKTKDDLKNGNYIKANVEGYNSVNLAESFNNGDTLLVAITVVDDHRRCLEGIDAVDYEMDNLTVVGATKWEEQEGGIHYRVFMLKLGETGSEATFKAFRECSKGGGEITINFEIE